MLYRALRDLQWHLGFDRCNVQVWMLKGEAGNRSLLSIGMLCREGRNSRRRNRKKLFVLFWKCISFSQEDQEICCKGESFEEVAINI